MFCCFFFFFFDRQITPNKIHLSRVHYVLLSVCMCECACVCVYVYISINIYFSIRPFSRSHQTLLWSKSHSTHPMFLNSFLEPVSKRLQKANKKTQFSEISLRNKPNLINHTKNWDQDCYISCKPKDTFIFLSCHMVLKILRHPPYHQFELIPFSSPQNIKTLPSPCQCRAVSWLKKTLIATTLCWWGV